MPRVKRFKFAVEAGRLITRDGQPLATLDVKPYGEGGPTPCEADELVHIIVAVLNRLGNREIETNYLGGADLSLQMKGKYKG